jgi:molybdopterin molybdotransferase
MNDHDPRAVDDVRMRGFAHRHTVDAALAWLDAQLRPPTVEIISLRTAAGRVLAAPVISGVNVPGFDRATMDGYAVIAESTEGATPYNRLPLVVIGDALPGRPFEGSVASGQAVRIMTGAPLPFGCDAVLPAEWIEDQSGAEATVSALAAVSPGKNVGRIGEDVIAGTTLFQAGRVLRPQDLGVLSSVGVGEPRVCRRPQVRLVVTGNELLPSGSQPHGCQIADANGPMLAALVERDGGVVDFPGLVSDQHDAIVDALHAAADVIIVSGGSSVGIEDLAPTILARHGELAIHGIAMRPSSPTGLGRVGQRLVFLLPGNPVSCFCAYDFFAGRAIRALGGRPRMWPYLSIRARLARKISSPIGRRSRRAAGRRWRIGAVVNHPRRWLRDRPRRQRGVCAGHRGQGLAVCVIRSSFSTCSIATKRSADFARRSTSRRAASRPSRSTRRSVGCWPPTSCQQWMCRRSTVRTWTVSR